MRNQKGQHIPEVAGALVIFLAGFAIPLVNLGAIPFRYCLIKQACSAYIGDLALCEKVSECFRSIEGKNDFLNFVSRIGGISLKETKLSLSVEGDKGVMATFDRSGDIPSQWLPDSQINGQLSYTLKLQTSAQISPIWTATLFGVGIPGLSCPLTVNLTETARFENLDRDPATGKFFLSE